MKNLKWDLKLRKNHVRKKLHVKDIPEESMFPEYRAVSIYLSKTGYIGSDNTHWDFLPEIFPVIQQMVLFPCREPN